MEFLGAGSALLMLVLLVGAFSLFGCVDQSGQSGAQQDGWQQQRSSGFGKGGLGSWANMTDEQRALMQNRSQPGGFGNMTAEERQKMMEAQTQEAVKACESKEEGAACLTAGNRGETNGTCQSRNGQLSCAPSFRNRQNRAAGAPQLQPPA